MKEKLPLIILLSGLVIALIGYIMFALTKHNFWFGVGCGGNAYQVIATLFLIKQLNPLTTY